MCILLSEIFFIFSNSVDPDEMQHCSGGSRGLGGGVLISLFHFHGIFLEKSGKIMKNQLKLTISNPFANLNPQSRYSGSALALNVLKMSSQQCFVITFIPFVYYKPPKGYFSK